MTSWKSTNKNLKFLDAQEASALWYLEYNIRDLEDKLKTLKTARRKILLNANRRANRAARRAIAE